MTTTTKIADRIYFVKMPTTGRFIAIQQGETRYSPTTVYDQDHADYLNDRQGITRDMAEAALICSMFDKWGEFDDMLTMAHSLVAAREAAQAAAQAPAPITAHVHARIEEVRPGYFYAHLKWADADRLYKAGMHGCPMGRGKTREAACADLERRCAMDLRASDCDFTAIEITATEDMA